MALNNNTPFGVREICDVVLRAKSVMDIGSKRFYRNEPVLYFDTLKTSTLEGGSTTVYATGGKGNARLMAWDGERTVTFTMEDALISPASLSVLAGANLIAASGSNTIKVHKTKRLNLGTIDQTNSPTETSLTEDNAGKTWKTTGANDAVTYTIYLGPNEIPLNSTKEDQIYVMILDNYGNIDTEPFIAQQASGSGLTHCITISGFTRTDADTTAYTPSDAGTYFKDNATILVDYYGEKDEGLQVNITPETFGGNFYLEASTLFRDSRGGDVPAEFIIPNCKIQSNFTFNMSATGDPSTFTFTMDAFPDYTRFDLTKKVIAAIQILDTDETGADAIRTATGHSDS